MKLKYFIGIIITATLLTLLWANITLYSEVKTLSGQVEKLRTDQNKMTVRLNTLEQRYDQWSIFWGKLYPQR